MLGDMMEKLSIIGASDTIYYLREESERLIRRMIRHFSISMWFLDIATQYLQ
jgi:hypothetical protein